MTRDQIRDQIMDGLVAQAKADGLLQDPFGRRGPAPTKDEWHASMRGYFVGAPEAAVQEFCDAVWLNLRKRMN